MNEKKLWEILCANCENSKKCHDSCEYCDEFLEKLELLENA